MKKIIFILALICFRSPVASAYYGSGVGADSLDNVQLGAQYGYRASYRFRAKNSQYLSSVRPYIIYTTAKPGYNSGTGGTVVVQLETDDGTGKPSGNVLASGILTNPLNQGHFPQVPLSPRVLLSAGTLYHIVFSNSDPNSMKNYVSVDCLYTANPTSPMQPTVSDMDSAVLIDYVGSPGWSVYNYLTSIIEMDYVNGSSEGDFGYVDDYSPQPISGPVQVRETFTVSSANQVVSGVSVRLAHQSGPGDLLVSLQNSNGSVIDQGLVSNTTFPSTGAPVWATVNFSSAHTLNVGQSYNLVLVASSNTVYQIVALEKGVTYGYKPTTFFGDGYAQFTNGSGWTGWSFSSTGSPTSVNADLPFYFTNTSTYTSTVLQDSPVLYWIMNDSSTQVADSSPHGNSGGTYQVVDGMPGLLKDYPAITAMGFNGTSSYASSGTGEINTYLSAGNGTVGGITAEVMFNPTKAISGIETLLLLGSQGSSAGYHWMYLRDDGTLCWQYADGTSYQTQCIAFTPSPGAVYDVTVTQDYLGKQLIFYLNGGPWDTIPLADIALPLNQVPVTVGSYAGWEAFFNGTLGNVSIYNYVLSRTQVANHWNAR